MSEEDFDYHPDGRCHVDESFRYVSPFHDDPPLARSDSQGIMSWPDGVGSVMTEKTLMGV
ncbi:hypothetical protein BH688_00025 [Kushneria phosphatilytica]|nr:hypothetical protein BH688_00025 [Kushneria phosphatilytica]